MDHRIDWFLTRPNDPTRLRTPSIEAVAQITCNAMEDALCRQPGPWGDDCGPEEFGEGECWASVWIEEFGAAKLWGGLEPHSLISDRITVWWDGGDWAWSYPEETTYQNVSVPDETVRS